MSEQAERIANAAHELAVVAGGNSLATDWEARMDRAREAFAAAIRAALPGEPEAPDDDRHAHCGGCEACSPKRYASFRIDGTEIEEPTGEGFAINADHLERQRDWSARTFGPGERTAGVVDHIRRELKEIEADPADLGEWADVIILAFDGAWRAGHQPQAILDGVLAKQERNEARSWPDWRTCDTSKAIEHVRSEPSPSPVGPEVNEDAPEPAAPPTGNFDAREWARSFIAHVRRYPGIPTDEGTMIGWFANAIMAGHDEAMQRQAESPAPVEEREGRYEALPFPSVRAVRIDKAYTVARNGCAVAECYSLEAAERIAAALNAQAQDGERDDLFRQYTALFGELLYTFGLHGDMPDAGGELLRLVRALKATLGAAHVEQWVEGDRAAGEIVRSKEWWLEKAAREEGVTVGAAAAPAGEREAEPVAWRYRKGDSPVLSIRRWNYTEDAPHPDWESQPLYAAPPAVLSAGVSEEVSQEDVDGAVKKTLDLLRRYWDQGPSKHPTPDQESAYRELRATLDRQPAPPAQSEAPVEPALRDWRRLRDAPEPRGDDQRFADLEAGIDACIPAVVASIRDAIRAEGQREEDDRDAEGRGSEMSAPRPDIAFWQSIGGALTEGGIGPDRTFWRYYFAGQALAGFCAAAAPDYMKGACADAITDRAVRQADLLLAKLEAEPAPTPAAGEPASNPAFGESR